MFKRLGWQSKKSNQKTRQLWEREFNIVDKGLDEKQVIDFVNNLIAQHKAPQEASAAPIRSLLKRAATDAEEITASIKMKAQTEAEDEVARILSQARQEAEEIKRKVEITAQKEAEEPVQLQEEAAEKEMKQPVQLREEAVEEEIKQPAQLQEEAAVPEPVEATTGELSGQHPPEERPLRKKIGADSPKHDSQALYAGEVDLAMPVPVDMKMVSKLYNYLQTIPEIKILRTRGSWDRGATVTVALDKPIPLISVISKMGGVKATPELSEKEGPVKGKLSSLLGKRKGEAKSIKLTLK